MKKFLCVVLVVLLLIPTLLRGEEDADILVVTAPSGATLRETPDTKAAKLGQIPYLAEVKRTDMERQSLNRRRRHRLLVQGFLAGKRGLGFCCSARLQPQRNRADQIF